ncbi:MAG TPA: ubiquinone/menaquinone biosynthesis methyltransferase [Candidatus Limnocylindria bacterium]|nr:ubiquinone/menaquinone biosynthesis methyltransferase [Candidatus Limnocylindria bacterium]
MSRSDGGRAPSDHDRRIATMFDRVAPRYDFLNRVLSARRDVGWRRRAVELARLGPAEVALDVGVGTGDLAFDLLAASDATARVVGIDLSEGMLAAVRARAAGSAAGPRFEARAGDAQALPFPDASFDRVTAGFAVRNFGDLDAGLREMRRVLRPAGRAVILELSTPPDPLVRALFRFYFHGLAPRLATLLGGDAEAYRYLPRSVARFPGAEAFARRLGTAGFGHVRFERLALGIAAIHVAEP